MPFPPNLEALFAAGYEYVRAETCRECGLEVEVYLTPGKRDIAMEPMPGNDSPAVRHLEVCSPLPASKDELFKVGYTPAKRVPCPICNRAIEAYTHATRPELWLNPMMGGDWPVVMHRCNISAKEGRKDGTDKDTTGRVCDDGTERDAGGPRSTSGREQRQDHGKTVLRPSGRDDASSIKLRAVRDPNYQLLAVGWQDGTLICQFKTAKRSYEKVPEAEFHKLTRSPFAYRIFNCNIKGKFKGTKIG